MRTILRDNYTPEMGAYHETLVIDETRHKKYLFDCDGVFTDITNPLVVSERGDSEDFAASQKWVTDIDDKVDGLAEDLGDEIQARTDADDAIWAEIEEIEMSSDVVDIVGTYAELQQYDTTHLKDNDIIKVLSDETHQDETAYYRWNTATDTFSYVGSEGPYYTESEVDALLSGKQDTLIAGTNIQIAADGKTISATDTTYTHFTGATASTDGEQGLVPGPLAGDQNKFLKADGTWQDVSGANYTAGNGINISAQDEISVDDTYVQKKLTAGANIQISANDEISATDTTYSSFVGTDGQTAGTAGLVPAPATTDEGKYLKADGTWSTVNAGPTVVQTTGTSTTDVMSQNATTSMVFADPGTNSKIKIGSGGASFGSESITIGNLDSTSEVGSETVVIGHLAGGYRNENVVIGHQAGSNNVNTVVIGHSASSQGVTAEFSVAIGAGASATVKGQFDISTGSSYPTKGYNSSNYRLLTGLYDPQNAHDAATKGYVDTAVTPNNISSNDWSALWQ